MNDIRKVSDMTADDMLEYLRIADASDKLKSEIQVHLNSAKSAVKLKGCFKNDEELDSARDMVNAVFYECARLYENKNPDDIASDGKDPKWLQELYDARRPLAYRRPNPKVEMERIV